MAGCGGRAYLYESVEHGDFRSHSETQLEGPVTVTASVLSREETAEVFGLSLYDQGIPPVWLEVENNSAVQIRYAPAGTDRFYFSPLEVAYKNRGGFSDETRSDFVFTHADHGAKGFNVDLFGSGQPLHFTFLMRVSGFVPDYANVDTDSIYATDEISVFADVDLYEAVKSVACYRSDESDAEVGNPINIVLIGAGKDLVRALLRSGWAETSEKDALGLFYAFIRSGWNETEVVTAASRLKTATSYFTGGEYRYSPISSLYLFGRCQDIAMQRIRKNIHERNHFRLWLAPMTFNGQLVWIGQISRDIGMRFTWKTISTHKIDPDVDETREFRLVKYFVRRILFQTYRAQSHADTNQMGSHCCCRYAFLCRQTSSPPGSSPFAAIGILT